MSMEKCPRCGLMADAVETIKAQRMPDIYGNRDHDLLGHVYYHPSGIHCAVPRIGEAYAICPKGYVISQPFGLTGSGLGPIEGTTDGARSWQT